MFHNHNKTWKVMCILKIKYSNKNEYIGYINNNKKINENGIIKMENSEYCLGENRNVSIYSIWIFHLENCDIYEGTIKNGIKEGFGKFKWKEEKIYIGTWKNNLRDGFRKMHTLKWKYICVAVKTRHALPRRDDFFWA